MGQLTDGRKDGRTTDSQKIVKHIDKQASTCRLVFSLCKSKPTSVVKTSKCVRVCSKPSAECRRAVTERKNIFVALGEKKKEMSVVPISFAVSVFMFVYRGQLLKSGEMVWVQNNFYAGRMRRFRRETLA